MSHLEMFLKIMNEQEDVKKTGWSDSKHIIKVEIEDNINTGEDETDVEIVDNKVVFVFDKDGKFVGMTNFKE